MTASPRFELVVDQEPSAPPPQPAPSKPSAVMNGVAIEMMRMALVALSQRALIALSACFNILLVGSAFVLWYLTPDPNPHQIVSLGMFAAFVLAAIYLNTRRK